MQSMTIGATAIKVVGHGVGATQKTLHKNNTSLGGTTTQNAQVGVDIAEG